jgi:hypothetical protein
LLVDDENDNNSIFTIGLQDAGFEVDACQRPSPFNTFQYAADPMILKIDLAISDSFSAYCQIAVHMLCSFSHNF